MIRRATTQRALELLASCRDGCPEALMVAHGFTIEQMVELVQAGLGHRDDRTHVRGLLDGSTHPRTRILSRLESGGFQGIATFSGPTAVRKFAIQHRYRCLRFRRNAERQINFGDAQPGFLGMPRRLISRHDGLEAVEGTNSVAFLDLGATFIHFPFGLLVGSFIGRLLSGLRALREPKDAVARLCPGGKKQH